MAKDSTGPALLIGVVVLAGIYFTRDATLNQPAPDFSLRETYGGHVDLNSYRGRPVLLAFWMTSCGICRRELPLLNRMAPELGRRGIAVVTIHLGGVEEARDYLRSNQISLTSLVDTDGGVGQAYHVSGVPKLVLIGADGKIKRTAAGMTDESALRGWMESAGGS